MGIYSIGILSISTSRIENERLQFLRASQTKLQAKNYYILHDIIQPDANPLEICKRVILPGSFTGGPRYM